MVPALLSASQVLSRIVSAAPADSPRHRRTPFTFLNLLSLSQECWAFSSTLAIKSFIKRKPPPKANNPNLSGKSNFPKLDAPGLHLISSA